MEAGNLCSRHTYYSDLHQLPGPMASSCPGSLLNTGGCLLGAGAIQRHHLHLLSECKSFSDWMRWRHGERMRIRESFVSIEKMQDVLYAKQNDHLCSMSRSTSSGTQQLEEITVLMVPTTLIFSFQGYPTVMDQYNYVSISIFIFKVKAINMNSVINAVLTTLIFLVIPPLFCYSGCEEQTLSRKDPELSVI